MCGLWWQDPEQHECERLKGLLFRGDLFPDLLSARAAVCKEKNMQLSTLIHTKKWSHWFSSTVQWFNPFPCTFTHLSTSRLISSCIFACRLRCSCSRCWRTKRWVSLSSSSFKVAENQHENTTVFKCCCNLHLRQFNTHQNSERPCLSSAVWRLES